jgi:hypothetical protein
MSPNVPKIASLRAVFDEPFKSFNNITSEMKEGVNLAITIASRPYNFLLLTSDSNQVNLLHHCYNTTKSGNVAGIRIGIYGIRRSFQSLSGHVDPPAPGMSQKE